MREWNLSVTDPGAYTLAADARRGSLDYTNDHIWELSLRGGEPPALGLHTTFGLRARGLRLFPRFVSDEGAITDPDAFDQPPRVHRCFPNYLKLSCWPLTGIQVMLEYWAPDSQTVAGRVTITNTRLAARKLRFEWVALLSGLEGNTHMLAQEIDAVHILSGSTAGLAPLLFMTGGPYPSPGPHPALALDLDLPPGSERTCTWVLATAATSDESFAQARTIAAFPWEKHIAALEVLNDGLLEIETGDPDWDAAFALAQKTAYSLILPPTDHLPQPSFVSSRHPDQGYSLAGDGSDYLRGWRGQSALEADFLAELLLPANPQLGRGFLENFLAIQEADGSIDNQPGPTGQRAGMLATPLLAQLAWRLFQFTGDRANLESQYPKLRAFLDAWFAAGQDRDGDGIPEWTNPQQTGLEDHPLYAAGQPGAPGAEITFSENPGLCALLFAEIQALQRIRQTLDLEEDAELAARAEKLRQAVEAAWDEESACYHAWDRETHNSPAGERLGEQTGPGELILERAFSTPVRVLICLEGAETSPRAAEIYLHGVGPGGQRRVEHFTAQGIHWTTPHLCFTSQRVYQEIDRLDIRGLGAADITRVEMMDFATSDITCLLPLLAGIPDGERAAQLVQRTLLDETRFWQPYGVPLSVRGPAAQLHPAHEHTSALWCNLIGRGLLAYGYRQEAAHLLNRLMQVIVTQLKNQKAFSQRYHVREGHGAGARHALTGLAPLGLFLETLGVRILSPTRVRLEGENPFPWPVTLRYRGLTIQREAKKTRITFPGGQTATVKSPEAHLIELEKQNA